MDLRQFLTSPQLQLPMKRTDEDFQGFVDHSMDTFRTLLDALDGGNTVATAVSARRIDIDALCSALSKVVKHTYAGQPSKAYDSFVAGVTPLSDIFQTMGLQNADSQTLGLLYRVRRELSGPLTREDLFHIPFEKRHLVSTQRYSIPGLPCLYLGGSLYTCWMEMGRPPFHELHASSFWLDDNETVSLLNFSNRPRRLVRYVGPNGEVPNTDDISNLLSCHLILWPLIAMCSVTVKHRASAYKPEYIVPQTVLQWLTLEHNYDGICYFSTHVDAITTSEVIPPCNLVFPARVISPAGRCHHLRTKFKMTLPLNWQLVNAINVGSGSKTIRHFDFEFLSGIREPYAETEFGRVEAKLNELAAIDRKGRANEGQVLP